MQTTKKSTLLKFASIGLVAMLALTGCNVFRVYTIDLPQGTPLSQAQADKVQIGMNANQVLYLLGSPSMRDTLAPNRWDYLYDYTAGTDGKRKKKPNVKDASQYLSIYFDNQGRVVRIDGKDSLPATRH
ncbi:outer membrane protein assembly factor BamE [uncultured Moraxella sp.]|uniref:outer membrane protein assembly factor BamE n=1 Tax=uncultured Moraxella sp. TaxID=263769 RepID=UPI0026001367|nr:outer membrane protein assembly factor BamE [uncultured Moraxella sp.]